MSTKPRTATPRWHFVAILNKICDFSTRWMHTIWIAFYAALIWLSRWERTLSWSNQSAYVPIPSRVVACQNLTWHWFLYRLQIDSHIRWYAWYQSSECMWFHVVANKWKHFPRYWPFVRAIHRSPVEPPFKVKWCGALIFFYLGRNKRLSKHSRRR